MAKIDYIKLLFDKTDHLESGRPVDIIITARLKFHPLDIKFEMAYQLHLIIVNAWADINPKMFLDNWDEAVLYQNDIEQNDTLYQISTLVNAAEAEVDISKVATIANLDKKSNMGVKAMGKLVPVFSPATKFSNNYIFNLHLK